MKGDECRGAGGVDRHAGTVQVVDIRQTVGSDAGRVAGRERGVNRGEVVGKTIGIICAGNADEDPAGAATQFRRPDSGVFQGLPGHLEQQALLGVHEGGFSGRNAKEPSVEPSNVTETAGSDCIRGSGMIPVRMQKCVQSPALGIDLGHQVPTGEQVFPEPGNAGPWEPERCPNNCDFSDHGAILCDFVGNETAAYQSLVRYLMESSGANTCQCGQRLKLGKVRIPAWHEEPVVATLVFRGSAHVLFFENFRDCSTALLRTVNGKMELYEN